jgi:hypothetical protein
MVGARMRTLLVVAFVLTIAAVAAVAWHRAAHAGDPRIVEIPRRPVPAVVPVLYHRGLLVSVPQPWGVSPSYQPTAWLRAADRGKHVAQQSVVTLDMVGLVGMPSSRPGVYRVPDVIGRRLPTALRILGRTGMPFNVRATPLPPIATPNIYASYCVISQSPAEGGTLTVHRGDNPPPYLAVRAEPC